MPVVPAGPPAPPPYSPETLPLVEEVHPGAAVEWDEVPTAEDGTVMLRVRPARYYQRAPGPIAVELEAVDRLGQRHAVARAEVQVRGERGAEAYRVPFGDEDRDLLYTARFAPSKAQAAALVGHVQLAVQAQLGDGKTYFVASGLVYGRDPGGRIVGNFSDEVRDGSLVIWLTVAIEEPGLYQVRGELFGPALQPIAETKTAAQLDRGEQRMALRFFGKALVDRGVDGPYRLRDVYLAQAFLDEGYDAMGPVLDEAYTTQPWRARDFSPAAWAPPSVTAEVVGPDHPSQQGKPPPLYTSRPTGPTRTPAPQPMATPPIHPDVAPGR